MAGHGKVVFTCTQLSLFICFITTLITCSISANVTDIMAVDATEKYACSFSPNEINQLYEETVTSVFVANCTDSRGSLTLRPVVTDTRIAVLVGQDVLVYDSGYTITNESFTVKGLFLGRTIIKIFASPYTKGNNASGEKSSNDPETLIQQYKLSVIRKERAIDHIFIGMVMLLVMGAYVGMGCTVDLKVVKEVLLKPIPPIIGFCCQYIIMPLFSFAIIKMLGLSGGLALGFFASGCAPGGGASNMYSFLLKGDVSLSVTMTLISTAASLGMFPLWLFTLGQRLIDDDNTNIRIPFQNIFISLATMLIPIAIGLLIQNYCKKAARIIVRCLKPFFIIIILFMFTAGVYANLYIFQLITPSLILAGCLLPYGGFLLSGFVAFLCRQPRTRIITIAIETAIQNTGLPILLMKFSLPQPEGDLSVISPVVIAMFTPIPLWIAITVLEIRRRCCLQKSTPINDASGDAALENETDKTTVSEANGTYKLVNGNGASEMKELDDPKTEFDAVVVENGNTPLVCDGKVAENGKVSS